MENRQGKRELILRSALLQFVKEGYDRATIQNIAKKAGVGKGTIYEYFPSKEALFSEVVLSEITHTFDKLVLALKKPGTIENKVKRLYEENAQLFHSGSDLRAIMLNDLGKVPKRLHQQLLQQQQGMVLLMENIFEEAVASGELTQIHPGVAAAVVLNGLMVISFYQLKEEETYEDIIEQQLQIIFSGLHSGS